MTTPITNPRLRSTPASLRTPALVSRAARAWAVPLKALLLLALIVTAAGAQEERRPMTIVDLINVPGIGDPQLAPDGSRMLYVRSDADWEGNRRISHIWRVDVESRATVQLTYGKDGERNPRWSPDGRYIAFLATRAGDEHTQIYLLPTAGGEAFALTEHATAVSGIEWARDGGGLYFLADDEKSEEEKAREKAKNDVFAFDENYQQRHLWRVTLATSDEERLTEGEFSVSAYEISRDGELIVYHRAPSPLLNDLGDSEVWLMTAAGAESRRLTDNGIPESGAELSPDGRRVLFRSSANQAFDFYYNDNIFVVPVGGGDPRVLLPDSPYEMDAATWSSDGRNIYFLANTGVRRELFRLEVASGRYDQLTRGDHTITGWRYIPSLRKHVFQVYERTNAGDIWMLDERDGARPVQVTRIFDDLDEKYLLPRQEAITWQGADGVTVEGLLFYPLDYQEGRRYPLVVQTHGGPASSDKFGFGSAQDYVQVLADLGYLVLQPNYRGSTGYGDDFLRDMVGHYFQNAHLDVMAGVDHLIGRGLVDGERMAKMGWSAGGHMTNKIITFTDRFKAASSGAGAANWVSMYGQSDVRIYRTPWFGGTPWQENAPIDVYWENSPLSDVSKVTTPTLVLVGENDVRVPMPQSVELYRALRENGVPTHLYVAPREPHGWRELRHALFKANIELDWFERHVMGREYEWEVAPGDEEKEAVTSAAKVHR
ncbi:MAG: S9 family peptidase [Gemmatimonadota bacterium]|nr:MAG: S9 family peptidase [Gemmatimonadota bacterium]